MLLALRWRRPRFPAARRGGGHQQPPASAQVRLRRPDVKVVPFRGNVETRLRKVLDNAQADATVLAMAGLIR